MKKALLVLNLMVLSYPASASYIFRNSASNINTGTLDPNRVSPSTFTMYGPIIPSAAINFDFSKSSLTIANANFISSISAGNITGSTWGVGNYNLVFSTPPTTGQGISVAAVSGPNVYIAGANFGSGGGGGGGGSVFNTTGTFDIKIPGPIFMSTSAPDGIPGNHWGPGPGSTRTVINLQGYCIRGSTVAGVTFQLRHSSSSTYGGQWGFDNWWGNLITSTMIKNGDQYVSPTVTSGSLVITNEYFWVAVTSMPPSGIVPAECGVRGYYWEQNPWSP